MNGRHLQVTVVALLIASITAFAQDLPEQVAAPSVIDQPEGSTEKLYEDVMLLTAIRELYLTSDQLRELARINEDVAEERAALLELRERTWQESGERMESVVAAWIAGRTADARDLQAADAAVNRVYAAREEYQQFMREAGERLVDMLTTTQLGLVESPDAAELRRERQARMGGVESIGEWMAMQIDGIRDLMPEEFRMLAESEARRIARTIFGRDDPNLEAYTAQILNILVEVGGWLPGQYNQQREDLPDQLEAALGLEDVSERPPVEWSELLRLVRSVRTALVVQELSGATDGSGTETPVQGSDDLQDAMNRADAAYLFLEIGLDPGQARQMISPLERIERHVERSRRRESERLEALETSLESARERLVEGRTVETAVRRELEEYAASQEQARQDLQRLAAAEMLVIAEVLHPQQNALLDWTPPEAVEPEFVVELRLEQQRVAMGRIQEMVRMLDRVKYLDPANFVTARMAIVNDYLARYFRPDSPRFNRAQEVVVEYTNQVRMLQVDEWEEQAMEISAELLDEIGLMPRLEPARRPDMVSWDALYRLVTNPQTLDVVREWTERQ